MHLSDLQAFEISRFDDPPLDVEVPEITLPPAQMQDPEGLFSRAARDLGTGAIIGGGALASADII